MSFSERYGYREVKDVVQRESMDEDLRVGLWNVLDIAVWSLVTYDNLADSGYYQLSARVWCGYLKRPLDTMPERWSGVRAYFREHVFDAPWYAVYDFLEVMVNDESQDERDLAELLNDVLHAEIAAYRFVGGRVTEITSPEEIAAIEDALAATGAVPGVGTHLRTALDLLADRDSPDYRNSIKESISAVEAMVNRAAGTSGKTLGVALAKLSIQTHPALDGAFSKLYGYTNDSSGIRHALMDEPNLEFEDAKFMLVACSAFVNYLVAKAARAGISV